MADVESLVYTSERVDPRFAHRSQADYLNYLFHVAAYRFAVDYTSARDVLDYGCGTGYGTALLAESAASVVGIDTDAAAVEHAGNSYRRPNLSFRLIGPEHRGSLPFTDHSFDTVVSFQVIEHIAAVNTYLEEINRVLRPGGYAVLATPDRTSRLFSFQRPWNRFHVTEYSAPQLSALLQPTFGQVDVLGMTASPAVIDIELRRTRRLRWMLLPLTLPVVPEAVRRMGLGALKAMSETRARPSEQGAADYGFDASSITIGPHTAPNANLVAVCRKAEESQGGNR